MYTPIPAIDPILQDQRMIHSLNSDLRLASRSGPVWARRA